MSSYWIRYFVLSAAIASFAIADERPVIGQELGMLSVANTRRAASTGRMMEGSYVRQVIAKDINVKPGDTTQFELAESIGGAQQVAITVTSLGDSNLSKVRFIVAFASPDDWYVVTHSTTGSAFPFIDHGAIVIPVAGPGLKIAVRNEDTTAITIRQLAVYAAGR